MTSLIEPSIPQARLRQQSKRLLQASHNVSMSMHMTDRVHLD
jgi:hypothetical protein